MSRVALVTHPPIFQVMSVILSENVVFRDRIQPAAIVISPDGRICAIHSPNFEAEDFPVDYKVVDVGASVVLAGVVDSHVHLNDPGREDWEGFNTGTMAAAAGGITTLVDMPLNSIPPTTTRENLDEKLNASHGKLHVDVAFWGGLIPSNLGNLRDLVDTGVVGFKGFLCPSGVDEFPHISKKEIKEAMNILQGTDAVLAFHAEVEDAVAEEKKPKASNPTEFKTFLDSRPASMEIKAVNLITNLCLEYRGVRCHVVHASASEVVEAVKAAREKGAELTVETCHHYLNLNAQLIPPASSQYKCCPPIRDRENQEALWRHLEKGDINMVVSDHSPSSPSLKSDNLLTSWGGISSLQFALSLMWTQAHRRGYDLSFVSRLLSSASAELCRLEQKGSITVGKDADLVVFDPDYLFTVTEEMILHKHKMSPYIGTTLRGRIIATFLRGRIVYEAGQPLKSPMGLPILLKKATT